ncbi:hypothetical protein HN51_041541 [Arachis hypogaea]|uniref:non-specific lipid-transfer protein 1-like n=1 Tax=Arachis ipaensis TaxID=130454 RepID=UPI0007AF0C2E|nr:non-specific lipid-transfer protein 1-like [Arachis ipaensis]XP_025658854.1 non-specific lipid-transfer protein 1 [Arachis hypogaea]QHN87311.1 Non-specific lipid-transfer protein [Arachis hypogaea]
MASNNLVVRLVCCAVVCAAALSVTTTVPKAEAAVSCGQLTNELMPCLSYILYGGNTVPQGCCNGVRTVFNTARTTPDRQAVCNCIKSSIVGVPYTNFNIVNAAAVPKKCGVNISYQISPNIDCSRVQ